MRTRLLMLGFLTAVSAFVACSKGDGGEPVATPTSPPDAPATNEPPLPTSPAAAAPETIEGVVVRPFTLGADVPLPAGQLFYYSTGKYAGDGGDPNLYWVYKTPSGETWTGNVFETFPGPGHPWSMVSEGGRGTIAVASCLKGFCGGFGQPSTDSEGILVLSRDGGVTWEQAGPLPRYSYFRGSLGGRVLISTSTDQSNNDYRLWWFPGGEEEPRVPDAYPRLLSSGLAWEKQDGSLVRPDGSVLRPSPPKDERYVRYLEVGAGGSGWRSTFHALATNLTRLYFTETDAAGKATRAFSFDSDIWLTTFAGPDTAYGNVLLSSVSISPVDFPPAQFDLSAGVIHPIRDFPIVNATKFVAAVHRGPFARVKGAGDCLNVRAAATPDAAVLGCFKDGVLFRITGDAIAAGGREWLPVETPEGAAGFAAAEFLER